MGPGKGDKMFRQKKAVILAAITGSLMVCGPHAGAFQNMMYYDLSQPPVMRAIPVAVQTDPTSFIEQMGSNAIAFLGDESLTKAQKEEKFEALLDDNFDMETIGRFVMGRYWRTMSDEQKAEYLSLFEDMVVAIYSSRFSDYNGQRFVVESARPTNDSDYIVSSRIVPPHGQTIDVKWHVREKNGALKIIDITIQDVSMALSKRSEFASIIQRGGGNPEIILEHLRDMAAGPA